MARIMVVDDTLLIRTFLRSILLKMGHIVVAEAKDGKEACIKYMMYKPDLVTMDITMQDMDGLDAVKYITEQDKDAKIVVISAATQKSMVVKALKNGARNFIIKPIDEERFIKVVNEILGIQEDIYINREEFQEIKQSIEEMKKAIAIDDKYLSKI